MKKCKNCNGRGFVFGLGTKIKNNWFYDVGEKQTCPKCFGKGAK